MENSLWKSWFSQFPEHNYALRDCGRSKLVEPDHKNNGESVSLKAQLTLSSQSLCKLAVLWTEGGFSPWNTPAVSNPTSCADGASTALPAPNPPQGQRLSRVFWLNSSLLGCAAPARLKCLVNFGVIQLWNEFWVLLWKNASCFERCK